MKKIIAMLLALAMVFALAACGSTADDEQKNTDAPAVSDTTENNENTDTKEPENETSGEPIKVGHLCDLTGVEAMTGGEAKAAMDFAVQYIGEICGRPIEVIHKDTQSSSSAAADAVRSLVEEDGVDVVFGPTLIGHKAAVASVAGAYEIPVVFYNPTPESMVSGSEWVLAASGSTPQMPTAMADYVYNELGYTKVVTLTKDDSGGKSYMNPFTDNFEAMGGEVLGQAWAPAEDTTDYTNYLMSVAAYADEADCLIAWTSASSALQLWKAWYQLGLNETLPIVAVMHGAFTDSFICDALTATDPDLVEEIKGTYAPMTWAYNLESAENQDFVAAYQAANDGAYPIGNNLPGATVQALLLLKAGVEALDGDTSDHAALRDAMLAADITGPEGRTVFEDGSNIATKSVYIVDVVQLENGAYNYSLVKEYADVPPEGLTVG